MEFFPIFLNLKNRKVLVVGGGDVACRKVDLLLRANADITVISPQLHPHLSRLAADQQLTYIKQKYDESCVIGFHQIWATTNDPKLNHQVFSDAEAEGIWTNVVDDPHHCHFITPSMIDRTPIQVAISSGGASPVLVRFIREKLETLLPQNLSLLAEFSGKQRERIKQHFKTVDERRKFWERFFRLPAVEQANNTVSLELAFTLLLSEPETQTNHLYLIETGLDPEMLTLKALRLMQQSDFVLYPEGSNDIFVDLCRRDADREPYTPEALQDKVRALLNEGLRVCVLAPKASHPETLISLAQEIKGLYIPCL